MNGQQLIAAERQRQIEAEGWTLAHDDEHGIEVLELAALCYRDATGPDCGQSAKWPWAEEWWKPKSRRRNLERAGALYLAAAEGAERAQDYARRDSLKEHVASCAILLDSVLARTTD
jgi:hypothetical protein